MYSRLRVYVWSYNVDLLKGYFNIIEAYTKFEKQTHSFLFLLVCFFIFLV